MQAFVVVIAAAILALVAAHHDGSSPCLEQFEYESQHKALGRWEGTFKLKTEYTLHGIWLRMILDKPAKVVKILEPASGFEVVEGDDKKSEYLLKNRELLLKKNTPLELKVLVEFDEESKDKEKTKESNVPRLLSYRLNGRVMCPVGAE